MSTTSSKTSSAISKKEFLKKSLFGMFSFVLMSSGAFSLFGFGKSESKNNSAKGFGGNGYGV